MKKIDHNKVADIVSKTSKRTNSVERYLANLEKEVSMLDKIVEESKNTFPEQIENTIKEVIREEFKAKRFNGYIAQDLFSAYVAAGGRKLVEKMLRQNPKQVLPLLKTIIDISAAENGNNVQATQVNINIQGLNSG